MQMSLMKFFDWLRSVSAGRKLPPSSPPLDAFYAALNAAHRWQGDVYPGGAFRAGLMPRADIPFWMLLNRTCHMYDGEGRTPKLPYLNFCPSHPIESFVERGKGAKTIKNQVEHIINQREGCLFLPARPAAGVASHLVANFNLIHTISIDDAPPANTKVLQLSSPFVEFAFQKFAAYFYTVGFDDASIKSPAFIRELVASLEVEQPPVAPPAAQPAHREQ